MTRRNAAMAEIKKLCHSRRTALPEAGHRQWLALIYKRKETGCLFNLTACYRDCHLRSVKINGQFRSGYWMKSELLVT